MKKASILFLTIALILACQSSKKEKAEKVAKVVVTNTPGTAVVEIASSKIITSEIIETQNEKEEVIENEVKEIVDTQPKTVETKTIESEAVIEEETIVVEEIIEEVSPSEEIIEVVVEEINEPEVILNFDHSTWSTFLNKHVTQSGNVNYKAIKENQTELNAYLSLFAKTSPNSTWTKNEKLAYWINAYNAFTIKLIIDYYPTKSIKDISKPWDKKLANINGKKVSLNYIEHDVLRKMHEPRIHFAINCASVSCPKLLNTAFMPETLNSQLNTAAKRYINSNENRIEKGNVKLSRIFKWFSDDFKTNGNVLDFINLYTENKVSNKENYKYLDYNWSLNE